MPFQLPPPWNPGFALPDNVRDEGLQRRAFVTKQMPRGTYDDPRVGNGGYVVPQYIDDEGYGQGTYTTKWMRRGTYNGPPVPHYLNRHPKLVEDRRRAGGGRLLEFNPGAMGAMGGVSGEAETPMPPEFESYGRQAAAMMMSHVRRLPNDRRKPEIKRIMDAIDPSLYLRTAEIATRYHRQGAPAGEALQAGIARAMSTGIAAEIIQTGRTRQLPAARSLLGLGCYGCGAVVAALGQSALGAALEELGALGALTVGPAVLTQVVGGVQSTGGAPNPPAGYTWDAGGFWRRVKVGEVPVPGPVAPGTGQGWAEGQSSTGKPPPKSTATQNIEIGPWVFEDKEGATLRVQGNWWNSQPALRDKAATAIAKAGAVVLATAAGSGITLTPDATAKIFSGVEAKPIPTDAINGLVPIFGTVHPITKKKMGLYITKIGTVDNPSMTLLYKERPSSWLGRAIDWLVELVSKIINVAIDVVSNLDTLACNLLGSPGIGAASTAVGGPAGAAGAGIAKGACAPTVLPPPPQSSIMPVVIIGGAALAALLLMKKKKAPTP